jgi:phosphotransferase system, enzyme I, PtsP
LWVNTGLTADATLSITAGAEGIGLYRTEIPFMSRDRFPTEEEQYVTYRQLLQAFAPRPVVMRTLDIGGDKMLTYFPVTEANPFLGWRGIRITLDHPEIFLVQIRAMLRASHDLNNLRILLPMISNAHEIPEALRLIKQAYAELREEGLAIDMPLIGVMIEVPSAIYLAKTLAQQVDFLSIGSNDLTQYLLAVDRNNARVANLYDALHPAVLHALIHVVDAARTAGKPLSICGEMAGDPAAVLLLLAMGFNALSMNSTALLKIKHVIRHFTLQQTKTLLAEVMLMDNAQQIRQHLEKTLHAAGLGMLVGTKK